MFPAADSLCRMYVQRIMGGMEGASDASRGDIGNKLQPLFYVNVVPTEGNELNDSIPSVIEKGNFLKYHITSIKIEQENTPKDAFIQLVMGIIAIPFSLITLGALYCFIRLILSIRKKTCSIPVMFSGYASLVQPSL